MATRGTKSVTVSLTFRACHTCPVRILFRCLLCLLLAQALPAQSSNGYLTVGLGSRQNKLTSQAALGGEWIAGKGLGVGGEFGAVAGHDSFGFILLNGYYHLLPYSGADRKLDPFMTAGVGAILGIFETLAMVSFGGGANYWFHRRLGLRVELRDMVAPNRNFNKQTWGFRAGLTLH